MYRSKFEIRSFISIFAILFLIFSTQLLNPHTVNTKKIKPKKLDEFRTLQEKAFIAKPSTPKVDLETYFPIQKGNRWEYNRIILPGCSYKVMIFDSEGTNRSISTSEDHEGINKKIVEIESMENLEGKKRCKIGNWPEYWDIKFSADMFQVDEVFMFFSNKSYASREPNYRTIFLGTPVQDGYSVGLIRKDIIPTYKRHGRLYTVTVPAGIFKDCIEIIEDVKTIELGWKTYFYYAPGIGQVLWYQTDVNGNPQSYSELVKYKISKQKKESSKEKVGNEQTILNKFVLSIEGTRWAGKMSNGDYYEYIFLPNGKLKYWKKWKHWKKMKLYGDDNDTWEQNGNKVKISFNDGYAINEGIIKNNHMSGTGWNERGKKWTWNATLKDKNKDRH